MDVATAFGRVLRRARQRCGLTQEALALSADIQRNYVSLLERGINQPSLATILALSNSLDCSAMELVAWTIEEMDSKRET